jgi:methylphosphotriester-DNA--protein-cysteine methyltransferase
MIRHAEIESKSLRGGIKRGEICFGGNRKLRIYGKLSCTSGKRMKKENRVFFHSEKEAVYAGFRPCGHCMRDDYLRFISRLVK